MRQEIYNALWEVHQAHLKLGRALLRLLFRQERQTTLQACPVCLGQRRVHVPPSVTIVCGQAQWSSTGGTSYLCPTCAGKGYIREEA